MRAVGVRPPLIIAGLVAAVVLVAWLAFGRPADPGAQPTDRTAVATGIAAATGRTAPPSPLGTTPSPGSSQLATPPSASESPPPGQPSPSASVAPTATANPSPTELPHPTATPSPSPFPIPTSDLPQPAAYDPSAILWTGPLFDGPTSPGGLWTASIDGSNLQRWTTEQGAYPLLTDRDSVAWVGHEAGSFRADLYRSRVGHGTRLVTRGVNGGAVIEAAGGLFVNKIDRARRDLGLWRFPLRRGQP
ncbi:MAG: hypothetical protein QOH61_2627 [Chloroflexota bacterium]|nr:hypothetical protein [Chloroflexota bacterium]